MRPIKVGDVVNPSTSGPLSCGCSQLDLPRQSFLGHGRTNVSGHMAEPTRQGSLYLEKWFDIQGFTNLPAAHFVTKYHTVSSSQNPISAACTWDLGCGVGVARSRRFLGGVRFLRTLRVGVGLFYATPTVRLNHFLHCTHKFGILTRACWNDAISLETFVETENSCCVPRFPLIASCYKIVDSQSSLNVMLRSRCQDRKFWKGRSWSRTFYPRPRNPAWHSIFSVITHDSWT